MKLNSLVSRIHALRQEEIKHYESMLQLSQVQRRAIETGDTDELTRSTEEKGRLITLITALETQISGISEEVVAATGSRVHVCNQANGGDGPCALNVRMAGIIREILVFERENQALLEQSIAEVAGEIRSADQGGRAIRAYHGGADKGDSAVFDDSM